MQHLVELNFPAAGTREGLPRCQVLQLHNADGGGIPNDQLKNKIILSGRAFSVALFTVASITSGCFGPSLESQYKGQIGTAPIGRFKRDDYLKAETITSLPVRMAAHSKWYEAVVNLDTWSTKAVRTDDGAIGYYILIDTQRSYQQGWAFWKEARDLSGQSFALTGRRDVTTYGGTSEILAAHVDREYLESIATGKITSWKLFGDGEQFLLQFRGDIVKSFLAKCDSQWPAHLAASGTPTK